MPEQSVGKVFVEIEAKLDQLKADLEAAKQQAAVAGQEVGQSFSDGVSSSVQAQRSALDAFIERAELQRNISASAAARESRAFQTAKAEIQQASGKLDAAAEASQRFAQTANASSQSVGRLNDQMQRTGSLGETFRRALTLGGTVGAVVGAYATIYATIERIAKKLEEVATKKYRIDLALSESAAGVAKALEDLDVEQLRKRLATVQKDTQDEYLIRRALIYRETEDRKAAYEVEARARAEREIAAGVEVDRAFQSRQEAIAEYNARLDKQAAKDVDEERRRINNNHQRDMARMRREDIEATARGVKKQKEEEAEQNIRNLIEWQEWQERIDKDREERQKRIADLQRQTAREVEESMKRTAQTMIDAAEQFRNLNQGGRVGQSDAFLASQMEGVQRVLNDIKRQQVRL